MINATKATPKKRRNWRPVFLATFRQTGNVLLSCHAAGIDRSTAYRERQRNSDFAAKWESAEQDATEALEAEARRRAMNSSDVLLIFLLKARRPAVYRENARVELTGAAGGPVALSPVLAQVSDAVLERRIRALERELGQAPEKKTTKIRR